MIHRAYIVVIDGLRADNKDLRDRWHQKNGMPPSGIDLTEEYEEKVEREKIRRDNPQSEKKAFGPIAQLTDRWTRDDRNKADRLNIDASKPSNRVN